MGCTSAGDRFLIPTSPYPFAPPPPSPSYIILTGETVVDYGTSGVVYTLSNLNAVTTGISYEMSMGLHYLSRGVHRIYNFVNNGNGTGSITVDFADNFAAANLIIYSVNNAGSPLNSGYAYIIFRQASTSAGNNFLIYPKFTPASSTFYAMLGSIPKSSFYNINQPYTVPVALNNTLFIVEVKQVGVPVTIIVTSDLGEYPPKTIVLVPDKLQNEVSLFLYRGTNSIAISTATDEYKISVSTTYIGTFLKTYAQEIFNNVTQDLNNLQQSVYSLFSSQVSASLLYDRFYQVLPKAKAYNNVALRLLLKSFASNYTTTKTVKDALIGLSQNTPVITPSTTDLSPIDGVYNPAFTDQELLGGNQMYLWSDNHCMYSWELFKKYVVNRGYSVVKSTPNEIVFYDDNDDLQRHSYDATETTCTLSDMLDFCYAGITIDIGIDQLSFFEIGTNYLLDSIITKNERRASITIQDLYYSAVDVGLGGNAIEIEYNFSTSPLAIVVTGAKITANFPSPTTAASIRSAMTGSTFAAALVDCTVVGSGTNPQVLYAADLYLSGGYSAPLNALDNFKAVNATIETPEETPFTALVGDLKVETFLPEFNFGVAACNSRNTATFDLSGTTLALQVRNLSGVTVTSTVFFATGTNAMAASATAFYVNINSSYINATSGAGGTLNLEATSGGSLTIDPSSTSMSFGANPLGYFVLNDTVTFAGEISYASATNAVFEQSIFISAAEGFTVEYITGNAQPFNNSIVTSGINGIIGKTLNIDVYDPAVGTTTTDSIYFDSFIPDPPISGGAGAGNTYTVATNATGVAYRINLSSTNVLATVTSTNHVILAIASGVVGDITLLWGDAVSALGGFTEVYHSHLIFQSKMPGHISYNTVITILPAPSSTAGVLTNLGFAGGETSFTVTSPTYPKTPQKEKYDLVMEDAGFEHMPYIPRFSSSSFLDNMVQSQISYPIITTTLNAPYYGLTDKWLSLDLLNHETGFTTGINIHFDPSYHPAGSPVGYYPFAQNSNTIDEVLDYLNLEFIDTYGGMLYAYNVGTDQLRIKATLREEGSELIIRDRLNPTTYPPAMYAWGFGSYYSENQETYSLSGTSLVIGLENTTGSTTSVTVNFTGETSSVAVCANINSTVSGSGVQLTAITQNSRVILNTTDEHWNIFAVSGTSLGIFSGSLGSAFINGKLAQTDITNSIIWDKGKVVALGTSIAYPIEIQETIVCTGMCAVT